MSNGVESSAVGEVSTFAATVANADEVMQLAEVARTPSCLVCKREGELAIVVIHTTRATLGRNPRHSIVGVCTRCRDAASESRTSAVAELVQAATRCEQVLSLIRHRADSDLAGWWGEIGCCSRGDVDELSVEVRRAVERIGLR